MHVETELIRIVNKDVFSLSFDINWDLCPFKGKQPH